MYEPRNVVESGRRMRHSIAVSQDLLVKLKEFKDAAGFRTYDDVIRSLCKMPLLSVLPRNFPGSRRGGSTSKWPFSTMDIGEEHVFNLAEVEAKGGIKRARAAMATAKHRKGHVFTEDICLDPESGEHRWSVVRTN